MKAGRFTSERNSENPSAVYAIEWAILSFPKVLTETPGTVKNENRIIRITVIRSSIMPAPLTHFFIEKVMNS